MKTITPINQGYRPLFSFPFLEVQEAADQMDKARRRAIREGRPDPSGQIYDDLVQRLAKRLSRNTDDIEDLIYLAVGDLGFYRDRYNKESFQKLYSQ